MLNLNIEGLQKTKCRFGCDGIIGIFYVPKGCICWNDPVQALCAHHALKAESAGDIILLVGEWPKTKNPR